MGTTNWRFRVDDIAAISAGLEAGGVRMLSEEMDEISGRLRPVEGREGMALELVQSLGSGDDWRV